MIQPRPHIVPSTATLKEAMTQLGQVGLLRTLFVVDENGGLLGSVTDGDVRRAVLNGAQLDSSVTEVMNPRPKRIVEGEAAVHVLDAYRTQGIRIVPVVDARGQVLRIVDLEHQRTVLPVHAVIMAGGRGERLRPLTDTLPKPLIPVGGKPIIEHALDLLDRHGVNEVDITVNYLRERIMEHLGDGSPLGMRLHYVHEDRPLGTAGSLSLVEEWRHDHVLLMNSDILTDVPLRRMYDRFIEAGADMAVATIDHTVHLPYAVMDLEGDRVRSFKEKPAVAFPCNAGIYLMHRAVVDRIPRNGGPYHATDLLQDVLAAGGHVLAFGITGHWTDIGMPDDLLRARTQLGA